MKRGFILIFSLACFLTGQAQSTGKYQIKFLEINKSNSDYGVAILDENKLIFTSADEDPAKVKHGYNARKDLYVGDIDYDGEIKNVKPVVTKMDKKYNQTGLAYTKDRKTVYFTRNRYWKKKKKQDNPKNKNLELYRAQVEADGSWTKIEKLSFNKKGSTISHPVLSSDDKQLYFVSDMKPSKGKTDIFVVDIDENGKYSKPRNLGEQVNTPDEETTPFISEDNILYFSSAGHPGKGKLDVFAVEIFDEKTSETYHLSEPINSINDDFAYIVNADNNQGYFTSNRLQGKGFNDLYSFTLEEDVRPGECFITVDGRVRDKESLELLSGATVDLYSLQGELLESVTTYSDGTYKFTVSCANEYKLKASNENYQTDEKHIEILEENYHSALHANINLTKMRSTEIAQPLPAVTLQPIYYEFDKSTITESAANKMDQIVEVMIANPNLIIEASSFTDARGSDSYNLALSKRRAKAAVEYLIEKGIDATRIKSKGYGEDKMINHCVDGVNCDENSHQMNRRTEFNFVNNPTSRVQNKKAEKKTEVAEIDNSPRVKKAVASREIETESRKVSQVQTAKIDTESMTDATPEPLVRESEVETREVAASNLAVSKRNAAEMPTLTIDENELAGTTPEPITRESNMETREVASSNLQVSKRNTAEVATSTIDENQLTGTTPEPIARQSFVKESQEAIEPIEKENEAKTVIATAAIAPTKTAKPRKAKPKNEPAVYRAKPNQSEASDHRNDMIAEERDEMASIEREKASYRQGEKHFGKVKNEEVKESVVINYNSTIVATNPQSNKVLNYIGSEKEKMIEKLTEIEKQYAEAVSKYPAVADSLSVEQQRIAEVIRGARELRETGWSNIIEYKNNALHFKRRYRELMVENSRGSVAQNNIDEGNGSIRIMEESAPKKKEISVDNAALASAQNEDGASVKEDLSIDQVQVTAMKRNGKGKYQVTSNANKTDLIKVTFKLKSKESANLGRKEAHLVLQNPEGKVAEAKGIFTIKESQTESKYTDHAIINFNNHDAAVTMFVQRRGSHFEKGVYPVKLFVEGELLAVANLNLKNQM